MEISAIQPESVFRFFREITSIPHGSGNENQIRDYITRLAHKHGYSWKNDHAGNLVVKKPAAQGYEKSQAVIIQGHLDMVCEKLDSSDHDFSKDPLRLIVKDGWLSADGTTLGADNGIGVAMALAVLFGKDIIHGPLECLFTVEEETGLIGATGLDSGMAEGKILLNLDTEDEGEFYIGCAGGRIMEAKKDLDFVSCPDGYKGLLIETGGLHGGHSGAEIHKMYANAILCSLEICSVLADKYGFVIDKITAPGKHNAIPRTCRINGIIEEQQFKEAVSTGADLARKIKTDYMNIETEMEITVCEMALPEKIISPETSTRLVHTLSSLPHGVLEMRRDVESLVNTSANFATAETDDREMTVTYSTRSFTAHSRDFASMKIQYILETGGFDVGCITAYPAWPPDTGSGLLRLCCNIWEGMYEKKPEIKAVHAGLECGIIGEKFSDLQMISFGPDIKDAHTPTERVNPESVEHVWNFTLELLKQIAEGRLK